MHALEESAPQALRHETARAVEGLLARDVGLDVCPGEGPELHCETGDVNLHVTARHVEYGEPGAKFQPASAGHLELSDVAGMVAGLAEYGVVEKSNLVGTDDESGSHASAHGAGLLLGQTANERLGRLGIAPGLVDVGVNDPKSQRKPFEKRAA